MLKRTVLDRRKPLPVCSHVLFRFLCVRYPKSKSIRGNFLTSSFMQEKTSCPTSSMHTLSCFITRKKSFFPKPVWKRMHKTLAGRERERQMHACTFGKQKTGAWAVSHTGDRRSELWRLLFIFFAACVPIKSSLASFYGEFKLFFT